VLIAEDETLIRDSLAMILSYEDDIEVVALTGDGNAVPDLIRGSDAGLAILDIDLDRSNGLDVAERIRAELPQVAVMILTSHGRPGYLYRAMEAGVRGFLTKDVAAAKLADVVRTVHRGDRYIDPEIAADAIAAGHNPLSRREREVLSLSGQGLQLTEIATRLSLSEGTVRNYMSSAITKLGTTNKVAAFRLAGEAGWI
jgi:two-component system, NarL family, response regulator DesR